MGVIYQTKKESENDYRNYIAEHISTVQDVFKEFGRSIVQYLADHRENIDEKNRDVFVNGILLMVEENISHHDISKYSDEEFDQYRAKWYTSIQDLQEKSEDEIYKEYKEAWKHHYQTNPHHPEFWMIRMTPIHISDRAGVTNNDGVHYLRMHSPAFVEMLCDWIAMSKVKHSSTYDWWMNNPGGRAEKAKMFSKKDVEVLDSFVTDWKGIIDFTVKE